MTCSTQSFGEDLLFYHASLLIVPFCSQVSAVDDIGMRDETILTQDKVVLWRTTDGNVYTTFENAMQHQMFIMRGQNYDND